MVVEIRNGAKPSSVLTVNVLEVDNKDKASLFNESEVEFRSDAVEKLVFPLIWVDFSLPNVMFSTKGDVEKFAEGETATSEV